MGEFYFVYDSLIGRVFVYSDGFYITGVDLGNKSREEAASMDRGGLEIFKEAGRWLDIYFSGRDPGFKLPVKTAGSEFCREVWRIIERIPYGGALCYGDIAGIMSVGKGKKMSARAVGAACGRNPVPLIIPCHRVLGKNGRLKGYSSGLDIKIKLLELEKIKYFP